MNETIHLDKRRSPRLLKTLPVKLETPSAIYKANTKDISEEGIFIHTNKVKPQIHKINLLIELPEENLQIKAMIEIVWRKKKSGFGARFIEITRDNRSRLREYIKKELKTFPIESKPELEEKLPDIADISVPIKIEYSVIVKRPKEEVYHLVKHMERFTEFMENVKQVNIVEERGNKTLTEWEVDIEGTTVIWKEIDIFDDKNSSIRFKMIEGDFGRYEGEWKLFSLLTGTEIHFTLIVDWGLRVLNKYTRSDLKKMTQKYAQDMLSALKKEMWVSKVVLLSKFACVIHPLDFDLIAIFDRNVRRKRESVLRKILERMPPFRTSYITGIKSLTGKEIEGEFVMCPLLPDQILNMNSNFVLEKIIEAGKIAQERGAKIFGLTAYTANIGRKGLLVANALNIPVTTGTSYTIATAIEATLKAAEKIGIELFDAKVVIIGATGNIGRICAKILADKVKSLTLVARNKERLDNFANFIRRSSFAVVKTSTIIEKFIFQDANIIITATSTPKILINVNYLSPGTVVCDMSLPKNISEEMASLRKDILVIDGGVVKPPGDVNFNFYFGLPQGLCYACMAEPMILALEKRYECYSIGGNISLTKVKEISQLALKHGFKLAEFTSFGREVREEAFEEVRRKI